MKVFYKKNYIKRIFILLFLLSSFIFISAISYVDAISTDIANSVFRLHVIANSDSVEDQNLKYKVRDAVLQYMNQLSINCKSKNEVIELAENHKQDFQEIAAKVIQENGYNYDVSVKIGNFDFPTKYYGDISLPSGNYEALRIEIGKATGQNWWCVMFPPLCFVDVTSGIVPEESKEVMKDNLSEEEYNLISNKENNEIKFKFSIIEMIQNLRMANK